MAKYYVYKIINKINNRFYIGKRKHKDPYNDSYMGSGKLIKAAIVKYGIENFNKHIIAIFENHEEACLLEANFVTSFQINDPMCYNMHEGGKGGFGHINTGDQTHLDRAKKAGKLGNQKRNEIYSNLSTKEKAHWSRGINAHVGRVKAGLFQYKHSEETKEKMSLSKKGNKKGLDNHNFNKTWVVSVNAKDLSCKFMVNKNEIPKDCVTTKQWADNKKQKGHTYGRKWITNPDTFENKYISNQDLIPDGFIYGRSKAFTN